MAPASMAGDHQPYAVAPVDMEDAVVPLPLYLAFGALLFVIGVVGVLTRRNAIIVLMSIELMLNAVNLTFISFSHYLQDLRGQVFTLFIIAVAASEAAVGLALVIALYRGKATFNLDEVNLLKW
jgi:NADH-quinone oxidoreductase subunit K